MAAEPEGRGNARSLVLGWEGSTVLACSGCFTPSLTVCVWIRGRQMARAHGWGVPVQVLQMHGIPGAQGGLRVCPVNAAEGRVRVWRTALRAPPWVEMASR